MYRQILRMTNCAKLTEMLIANEFYLHRQKKHLIFKQKETNKTFVTSMTTSSQNTSKQALSQLKKLISEECIHKKSN